MYRGSYSQARYRRRPAKTGRKLKLIATVVALLVIGFFAYSYFAPNSVEKAVSKLQFDATVSEGEKQTIKDAMQKQSKTYWGSVTAKVDTSLEATNSNAVLAAYVPVTNVYAARQSVGKADLASLAVNVPSTMDDVQRSALAKTLGLEPGKLTKLSGSINDIPADAIAFVPATELTYHVKLLSFEGSYYLDSFSKGAIFRQVNFSGGGASGLNDLALNSNPAKDATLKVNMTGVTALTREMMKKLTSVKDATYFSKKIGDFLADADITHVSNEVSFKPGCPYSRTAFCAPPEMIDTLKASGVDLVELTGNHNNDTGNQYNTDSINLYHSLGWHTFGGGLNEVEGAKPFVADQKHSKVAFLGYNYADAPGSGAIALETTAGANHFDADKVRDDIAAAKKQADFVIVDVQFWECYSYPDGYVEFPECDVPIGMQSEVFRQIISDGADMVVGTQAHQPQTYELYKGKPIYYGLGNLYFEQTQWPGTERGIILTHYFVKGKLVQTKMSPTVYDSALQTHLMSDGDAVKFLQRLDTARQKAL